MSRVERLRTSLVAVGLILAHVSGCSTPEADPDGAAVPEPPRIEGRWRAAREPATAANDLTAEQQREIERLSSIGYLSGSAAAPDAAHVTVYEPDAAYEGYNLYSSGHAAEAILMNMEGRVLHRWSCDLDTAWPSRPRNRSYDDFWRRVFLYPNGDLLAIYEGIGVIKLDAESNLIWRNHNNAHHDLEVLTDGSIYVLTRKAHVVPWVDPDKPILEDFVSLLNPDGTLRHSFSVLEAFRRSEFRDRPLQVRDGDLFHTNTLEILGDQLQHEHPAFAPGHLLVSLLYPGAIGVIDPRSETFVWWATGSWHMQHQPEALANGRLLLFDNNRGPGEQSRVLELDPETLTSGWTYEGSADEPFYTSDCGSSARLPNGNTLITESNNGRAFEVTPAGDIVWEFYNPHRAGEANELIATLFEMIRLPPDTPTGWAQEPPR